MQEQIGRGARLGGVSLSVVIALISVGAIGSTVAGCEDIEGAVTCVALESFRPTINASVTGEAGVGTAAVTRTISGSSSIPSGVRVAGIEIEQRDVDFEGTGTGTMRLLLAVDSVVVAVATVNVTNGQITSTPGQMRLGVFNATEATAIINALPVQSRAGLRLATSQAEAVSRTSAAVRSNGFQLTIVGQLTGNLDGTATLESIGFFCD